MDAGCQWGHVYKTLVNGHHDGLMVNGGNCPFVGVSGFVLGGGLGPFTRSLGMGSDSLVEATVVTADGELVTVDEKDPPDSDKGKLFWALRGAGGGNFGVLVEMKLKVHNLQNKDVVAGKYEWPEPEATDDFMTTMNDLYTTDWPEQMTVYSTWVCDLRGTSGDCVRFQISYDGNKGDFDKVIGDCVKQPELAKQLKRRSLLEPSTRFLHETLVFQWSEETIRAFPSNKTYSMYSSFVFNSDKNIISEVTKIIQDEMKKFRQSYSGEKAELLITWIHSGGKAGKGYPDTAFFWREAVYHTYVTVDWDDKWMATDMQDFLEGFKNKLRPLSLKHEAAFINFPDGALSKDVYENAYFGENREKLRSIKGLWDKDNFFNWSQGVQLPSAISGGGSDVVDTSDPIGSGRLDASSGADRIARDQWESFEVGDFAKEMANLGFYEQ